MNVKQALKEKNKLVKQITEAYAAAAMYNSVDEDTVRKYNAVEKLKEAEDLTNKLVDLKTKIHKANSKVYDKIFLMAELKGKVNQLRRINTAEGKSYRGYGSTVAVNTVVQIDIVKLDNMVKEVEAQIEKLQDELDVHNATTSI